MPDFPTQVEPLPPAPLPPSAQQAAITPVTQDAVMNVKSPVTMKTLFTPGHTEGGCCYYITAEESGGDPILQLQTARVGLS